MRVHYFEGAPADIRGLRDLGSGLGEANTRAICGRAGRAWVTGNKNRVSCVRCLRALGVEVAPALKSDEPKSWGHAIRLQTEGERGRWHDKHHPEMGEYWHNPCTVGRRCKAEPVYLTFYYYVIGLKGRTTERRQGACAEHGASFAKKHGLELPTPEPAAAP